MTTHSVCKAAVLIEIERARTSFLIQPKTFVQVIPSGLHTVSQPFPGYTYYSLESYTFLHNPLPNMD